MGEEARQAIEAHFAAAGRDGRRASETYSDDAVLEFPQGGERIRGKSNIIAFRSAYPASLDFEMRRMIGCDDLWINEYVIRYDGKPSHVIGVMEFRDDKAVGPFEVPAVIERPSTPRPGGEIALGGWSSTPTRRLGAAVAAPMNGTKVRSPAWLASWRRGDRRCLGLPGRAPPPRRASSAG